MRFKTHQQKKDEKLEKTKQKLIEFEKSEAIKLQNHEKSEPFQQKIQILFNQKMNSKTYKPE